MKRRCIYFILISLLFSCSPPSHSHVTTFKIRTTQESNHGTPFYAVVKATDFSEFILDDYQKIANENLLTPDHPQAHYCLIPGLTKTIKIKTEPNKRAAIYFLFTNPGSEWKFMTNYEGNSKVKLLLGENEIQSTSVY